MSAAPMFRFAEPDDIPRILELIRMLAAYENAEDEVAATPDILRKSLFEDRSAEVVLAELPEAGVVGMAVFFRNFSTWTGCAGMYLEDLIVDEAYRGIGVGRRLMAYLAALCRERGWKRFDWSCLDWNEPSLGFYRSLDAVRMDEWVHHRLEGEALERLASEAC